MNFDTADKNCVYNIKPDLHYKARLIYDGNRVDHGGLSTCDTVVKSISVCLLNIITDFHHLDVLYGDIGNAFIQVNDKGKIYTRCESKLGARVNSIAIITCALYGLIMSDEWFHMMFTDFLRTLYFFPFRFDCNIWMHLRNSVDGYGSICTHIDDFNMTAWDPGFLIHCISSGLLIKEHDTCISYIYNDYTLHYGGDIWTSGCQTYTTKAIA